MRECGIGQEEERVQPAEVHIGPRHGFLVREVLGVSYSFDEVGCAEFLRTFDKEAARQRVNTRSIGKALAGKRLTNSFAARVEGDARALMGVVGDCHDHAVAERIRAPHEIEVPESERIE